MRHCVRRSPIESRGRAQDRAPEAPSGVTLESISPLAENSQNVTAPDGTRAEVKSSAYLQAWDQARPSNISFRGLRARTWVAPGAHAVDETYNADVYVFAVQTATTHEAHDALDLDQWQSWVAPAATISRLGQARWV